MTHDLLKNVIEGLDVRIDRIEITDLRENTFFALIHLSRNGESLAIDSRPSDAMALALRAAAPIFVESQVLEKSSDPEALGESEETERLRRWLESVDPEELGRYEM
jgi:bifunctional DNase/RNase